jgi:hypothetical protein
VLPQGHARLVEPAPNRTLGQVERVRSFGSTEALDIAQHEDLFVVTRQSIESLRESRD